MIFLNPAVFFGFIPLYFIYKHHKEQHTLTKTTRLLFLSIVFMFFAMSRPALKHSTTPQRFDAQEYVIALDVSYSMQATDLQPTRYIYTKNFIQKLLKAHPRDRFTLFVFTSNPLLISPPTTDTNLTITALNALNPKYILTKATHLKPLFQKVAQLPMQEKKLLLFSDGGEERNLEELSQLLLYNHITPYMIATASSQGAPLQKDGSLLKKKNGNLVISRINPLLEQLALTCKGYYYEIEDTQTFQKLSHDMQTKATFTQEVKVHSATELFFIPLLVAFILFLMGVTKLQKFFPLSLLFLLMIPHQSKASLLDFSTIKQAHTLYKAKHYKEALHAFKRLPPSTHSYYNIAACYYKTQNYKTALSYYAKIKTQDPKLKASIYYNMANCAVALKDYTQAKKLYLKALALTNDKEALQNLQTLQKYHLHTQKNVLDMIGKKPKVPPQQSQKKEQTQQQHKTHKSTSSSQTPMKMAQKTQGKGADKAKKTNPTPQKTTQNKPHFSFGYKAYELINKGYTHENNPW